MKKMLIATLTVIMMGGALVGCGSKSSNIDSSQLEAINIKTSDVVSKIKEKIEMRAMTPIEGQQASEMFYLNLDDIEEFTIEQGMINTGLETIAVIKAKDGKVNGVKTSLEKVKEDKKSQAFYPGEAEAVDRAKVESIGNYVGLFIIPDSEDGDNNSEKALETFKEALKSN